MLLCSKLPLRLSLTHCPESCSGPAQKKSREFHQLFLWMLLELSMENLLRYPIVLTRIAAQYRQDNRCWKPSLKTFLKSPQWFFWSYLRHIYRQLHIHHAGRTACISSWLHDIWSDPEVNLAIIADPFLLCSHAAMLRFLHLGVKKSDPIDGQAFELGL